MSPSSLRHQHPAALQQRPNLSRRQFNLALLTIDEHAARLQIGFELTLRGVKRVAPIVTELRFRARSKFECCSDLLFRHGHGGSFRDKTGFVIGDWLHVRDVRCC